MARTVAPALKACFSTPDSTPASTERSRPGAQSDLRRNCATTSPRSCGLTASTRTSGPASSRSEEHTSELQSLMRISYAVFCLKKNNSRNTWFDDRRSYLYHLEILYFLRIFSNL